jgi:hypothetical protein
MQALRNHFDHHYMLVERHGGRDVGLDRVVRRGD